MIQHVLEIKASDGQNHRTHPSLVGCDPCMRKLRQQIAAVARRRCTILINGESGTGKELVARHIHAAGRQALGPFVVADCTALPEALIASQLFGHEKGAFTDAKQSTLGLFRAAHGGTLFIDEIGEMQLQTQAALLRCIQEHSVLPVGAVDPIHVDVHIIVATHRNLREMVADGRFREDLYYRLDVLRLEIPPLRDRRGDIALLAEQFLEDVAKRSAEPTKAFSVEALASLKAYSWPGNVRELQNTIERAVALSESNHLTITDLPKRMHDATRQRNSNRAYGDGGIAPLHVVERWAIEQALRATEGNQSRACRLLGVERHRLSRMIRRHGLQALIGLLRSGGPSTGPATDRQQSSLSSNTLYDHLGHDYVQPLRQ